MFAPTKTYRRWHRKINKTQKRQALASCLSATAVAPLVEARGHRISETKEVPLVVVDDIESIQKTKDAVECLENLGLSEELAKCQRKQTRPGKGKMRGRRYKRRRGPLVVYKNDEGCVKAFRNIPGVDLMCVDSLNLLSLAPGGHVGRLCVWSKSAFESLQGRYSGRDLPKVLMKNDLNSLINSDEIQGVINDKKTIQKVPRKRNLLASKKSRYETFRGFSLEEVSSRKRKAETMDKKERKKLRQS
jgi:large subunit ribosomal protein L4e